jgi:hypothetical protein
MKKMAMVLVCVMLLSAFAIGSAAVAAVPTGWYNCTVTGRTAQRWILLCRCSESDGDGWQPKFLIDSHNAAAKARWLRR